MQTRRSGPPVGRTVPGVRAVTGRIAAAGSAIFATGVLAASSAACPQAPQLPERSDAVVAALREISTDRLRADITALAACGTRHPLSPTDDPKRGVGAARNYLEAELRKAVAASNGRARLRVQPFDHPLGRGSERVGHFVNFIFELPGRDASRGAWIVGGHYDSRNKDAHDGTRDAPGADDDASGTAVVLELARTLARQELAAPVLLCAFDGEEYGLFGSDLLAQEMKDAGQSVEGMFTNDIVGSSATRRRPSDEPPAAPADRRDWLRCFSEPFPEGAEQDPFFRIIGGESDGLSRQLARFADATAARYLTDLDVVLVQRRDRFGRGGDHSSFTKRGYAGARFTEDLEDYRRQHEEVAVIDGVQFGDRLEFVDFDYVAKVARANLAVVLEGAGAPPAPATVHLDGAVKPFVTIQWSAVEGSAVDGSDGEGSEVPGAAVAGYQVWCRATDEPQWNRCRVVARGTTRCELPGFSIDDWHFGVATLGSDGRASPVRFPTARPRAPARRPPPAAPAGDDRKGDRGGR